jgi:methionyl-tRNA formyltransferase
LKLFDAFPTDNLPFASDEAAKLSTVNCLVFPCADGYVAVRTVQAEGGRRMSAEDFLRGQR